MKHFLVTPIILLVATVVNTEEHLSTDVLNNPQGHILQTSSLTAETIFLPRGCSGVGLRREASAAPAGPLFRGHCRLRGTTPENWGEVTGAAEARSGPVCGRAGAGRVGSLSPKPSVTATVHSRGI